MSAGALILGQGCNSSTPAAHPPTPVPDASTEAGGDASAEASTADASAEAQAVKTWDWTGIVGTGQSLSVGAQGSPIMATTQRHKNLKLSLGTAVVPPFDPTSSALSMVPLVEPIRGFAQTYPSAYPLNIDGETPHTVMADQITSLFQAAGGDDYVTVHTVVGESGQPMSVIDKTAVEVDDAGMSMGRAYAATLFEASAVARLAVAAGKTYGIGAIVLTHGESDSGSLTYKKDLIQLWSDYNQDLPALTGQTKTIPMLVSQQHSEPTGKGSTSPGTLAEWQAGIDHPGDIICSGPKYQYPYYLDGIHLTTPGYERLGEKYAEVYFQKVVLGQNWQPLQPVSASRAGSVITVHFHVPVLPLAWDDTLPAPHVGVYPEWAAARGFEVSTLSGTVTINSVVIQDDTVQITCATDVTGLFGLSVAYAYTADGVPAVPGATIRWGNLRDSDAFVGSVTGTAQPNYCVAFSMAVP